MKNATTPLAPCTRHRAAKGVLLAALVSLTACSTTLQAVRPVVYDFGPGALTAPAPRANPFAANALIISDIRTGAALDSTAVQYRLAYVDALQLKPYAQARWSMTPAELIRQRLRDQLGLRHTLLSAGEGGLTGAGAHHTLSVDLEEFSQLFETPGQSVGLLRLRATLALTRPGGERQLAQRSIVLQRAAPSADASGGVRALTAAADAAAQEIDQWLASLIDTAR